jgi:hypothetical protein
MVRAAVAYCVKAPANGHVVPARVLIHFIETANKTLDKGGELAYTDSYSESRRLQLHVGSAD